MLFVEMFVELLIFTQCSDAIPLPRIFDMCTVSSWAGCEHLCLLHLNACHEALKCQVRCCNFTGHEHRVVRGSWHLEVFKLFCTMIVSNADWTLNRNPGWQAAGKSCHCNPLGGCEVCSCRGMFMILRVSESKPRDAIVFVNALMLS